jgi:hypothetical protein
MKTSIASRPLRRAFYAFLIAGAAFWAIPRIANAHLYVTQGPSGHGFVSKYDAATGVPIDANFITGLGSPNGIALLGNKLFVASYTSGTVGEYDASTGAAIDASFIMGLTEPVGLAVKSQK